MSERKAYRKLVEELKKRPNFIIICSDGKNANTIINGNDNKIVAALISSILNNGRSKNIFETCKIMLSNNKLLKEVTDKLG